MCVCQTVLPPSWQAAAMQACFQTHPNMPSSWPRGQCSCLARNSDWLEYQWQELNPKQLLTGDIKQSGESSHRDLMMPPGKHVLAYSVVLFNTTASKQLITISKRWEVARTILPHSHARSKWEANDLTPRQLWRQSMFVSTLPLYCSLVLFFSSWPVHFLSSVNHNYQNCKQSCCLNTLWSSPVMSLG